MTSSTVSHRARASVFARAVAGLFLFGFSAVAAEAATCGSPIEPGQYGLTFQSGGVERKAVYVIPSSYTGKKKVPLVLDFHGSNSNPKVQLGRSHWNEVAEREGFVVMALAGSLKGAPNRCVYGTTKAAVIGLTKSVAADFVSRGIRCNAICPGTVESPSLQDRMRAQGDYDAARAAFIARQPMGRLGTPEEIADLAVYIAGATYTSGQAFAIDGGWTI